MLITANVRAVDGLAADLIKAGQAAHVAARAEVRKAAVKVRAQGRANAPTLTGELRRSITYRSTNKGLRYEVGPTAFYGRFHEYGTVHMQARPFMGPAAEGQQDLPDRVRDAAADVLAGATRLPPRLT